MKGRIDLAKRILVTGGAGFIGSALIKSLLENTNLEIFNIDKLGYASDLRGLNTHEKIKRHHLIKLDLFNYQETIDSVKIIKPDLIIHLAAESHVDRSIKNPKNFLNSNIIGTFNLLTAAKAHYETLNERRKSSFIFHHVSTDEVFGTVSSNRKFSEETSYDPRSPYSATKAASDHLVKSWFHTYQLPILITNCSNNFGPWQHPEKLIPKIIISSLTNETIPIYGDGMNIRDWLYVDDHINGLTLALNFGKPGETYCIGGNSEKTNLFIAEKICKLLDKFKPKTKSYLELIRFVEDRAGHDKHYAINPKKIMQELGWKPKFSLEKGLNNTVLWYLNNIDWCIKNNK